MYIFMDSELSTNATASLLCDPESGPSLIKNLKKEVIARDWVLIQKEAITHSSVRAVSTINWLQVWEAARDFGPYHTKIMQRFYKLVTTPLFGDRLCPHCTAQIDESNSFLDHLGSSHCCDPVVLTDILASLHSNPNFSLDTFNIIRIIVVSLL